MEDYKMWKEQTMENKLIIIFTGKCTSLRNTDLPSSDPAAPRWCWSWSPSAPWRWRQLRKRPEGVTTTKTIVGGAGAEPAQTLGTSQPCLPLHHLTEGPLKVRSVCVYQTVTGLYVIDYVTIKEVETFVSCYLLHSFYHLHRNKILQ